MQNVLVIDDEPDILELLDLTLTRMGLDVTTAASLTEGRRALAADGFNLCLTDMKLPDGNGLDLVDEISRDYPNLPTAVITAHGKVEDAVKALKAGAFDFVSKPVDLNDLRNLVNTALRLSKTESRPVTSPDSGEPKALEQLIGKSDAMERVRQMIKKLARSQAPVLISGASGTGKELAAKLIHELGPRSQGPFVPVNCGAIPSELMESEFFGHKRGSFTGASEDKDGLFQAANAGTLFLDEVADLPLHMQVKLLRAIQEKAIRPIGAREEVSLDVRILSATHRSLRPLVESGDFRSDLFFRLNVIELPLPSLHHRAEDIPGLAEHFLAQLQLQWESDDPFSLSDGAKKALQQHHYSGNVRELVNVLQRAMTMCDSQTIEADDLQLPDQALTTGVGAEVDIPDGENLDDFLENIERKQLEDALKASRYNKTAAAEKLGISFRSLRYKLKKYDIE